MWPFQPRGLPSTRWTLARAHAAAAPALQKPLTKRRKRFRGLRARPLSARRCPTLCSHNSLTCAACCTSTHLRLAPSPRLPFCAFPSHASQFAVCLRALCGQRDPTGLLRDAAAGRARGGAGTTLRYCCRYGCQVRLSGTALRYGSQVLLRAASAPVILAHTRAPSSPISAHLPSPHRRTYRYGSQVRLSGTALRYCSAQHPRP